MGDHVGIWLSWQCMVYAMRVLFGWSCSLGPTRHTHIYGKGERKASKGLLLASCMDDAMVKLVELGNGSAQAKERRESIEETTGREKSKEMLMGCSPRLATTIESGSCARPYTVYARQVKREQASKWRAEHAAAGEQPGMPFYRPRRELCHNLLLVSFRMQQWC
jgi:hypothetical protein